jgi:hypothetical protein
MGNTELLKSGKSSDDAADNSALAYQLWRHRSSDALLYSIKPPGEKLSEKDSRHFTEKA